MGLKVGDVVTAVVQAKLSDTNLLLQLGGKTVVAESGAALPPGTQLKLEVIKLGTTPELRPLAIETPASDGTPTPTTNENPQNPALRLFLPKQIPLAEFTAALPELLGKASALPAPIKQAIASLLATLPNTGQLATPEGLARALKSSGIFLEARMAAAAGLAKGFPEGDFKGQLLVLLDRLGTYAPDAPTNTPAGNTPETANAARAETALAANAGSPKLDGLLQKVEGALARIGLDQLASLPQPDGGQTWSMAIPYANGERSDTAQLRITAEDKRSATGEVLKNWSVNLELKPPGLGTFCARIVLMGGKIDTYLWSDTAGTAGLMLDHSEFLRARLEQAGLAVGRLDTLEQPPASTLPAAPTAPLLDLRA